MTEGPCIILVGVSGSGKTTVGHRLAQTFHLPLIDVDEAVSQALGTTIGELLITADQRFAAYRQQVAADALALGKGVIVLGASQVHDPHIVAALTDATMRGAQVVELVASTADVAARQGLNVARPVSLGAPRAMLTQMIAAHRQACAAFVTHSIETHDFDPIELVDMVARACKIAKVSFPPNK
ncbi:shikimate kinase [Schaalia suimastitidis]|uniref:shikimate kinase n=1 Tax=Schaalia suimastitidis TaxID=121163 RepID=UPI00047D80FA|nr:shikimate kinase [Schaalia suimastitidis]